METETKELFSLEDASKRLGGCSVWTLRKHQLQGTISVVRIGKRIFLNAQELSRIAKQGLPSLKASEPR
jgi:hypothetical protein